MAAALACVLFLAGCELLGIEDPAKLAERQDAEGRAIGAGCRHAGRAIEDCYSLNPRALKSAIFAGWKDMNDYMRENKIEVVSPEIAGARDKTAKSERTEETRHPGGEGSKEANAADAEGATAEKSKTPEASKARSTSPKHT